MMKKSEIKKLLQTEIAKHTAKLTKRLDKMDAKLLKQEGKKVKKLATKSVTN